MRERGDIGLLKLSERGRSLAVRCIYRATHQGIGILRKDLVVIEIVVVEKEEIRRHAIFALNRGSVDLWNASVEQAIPGTNHQRTLISDGVRQSHEGGEVSGVEGNPPGIGPQRIRLQSFRGERLQVVSPAQAKGEAICHPDRILQKSRVLVGVGMSHG
jgi:hypothetical protein